MNKSKWKAIQTVPMNTKVVVTRKGTDRMEMGRLIKYNGKYKLLGSYFFTPNLPQPTHWQEIPDLLT